MTGPCISTLHSLTGDGGVVTALDLVIVEVRSSVTALFSQLMCSISITGASHSIHRVHYV